MKTIVSNGRVFVPVTPVKSLFRSTMIHDVITSGRQFVVDLDTQELTIYDPSKGTGSIVSEKDRAEEALETRKRLVKESNTHMVFFVSPEGDFEELPKNHIQISVFLSKKRQEMGRKFYGCWVEFTSLLNSAGPLRVTMRGMTHSAISNTIKAYCALVR